MENLMMLTTIAVALITAVIGPAIVEWVKAKLAKKEEKISTVKEAIDLNELVDSQLDQLMEDIFIPQENQSRNFLFSMKN